MTNPTDTIYLKNDFELLLDNYRDYLESNEVDQLERLIKNQNLILDEQRGSIDLEELEEDFDYDVKLPSFNIVDLDKRKKESSQYDYRTCGGYYKPTEFQVEQGQRIVELDDIHDFLNFEQRQDLENLDVNEKVHHDVIHLVNSYIRGEELFEDELYETTTLDEFLKNNQ